jgi:DNA-binding IclR family transcriptional regulator
VHCTALGKALLAHIGDPEFEQIVSKQGMLRYNENTITSLAKLKEQCAGVRRLGYSTDDEEEEIGIRCVGVPVFDSSQRLLGAISITGTAQQLNAIDRFLPAVRKAALAISRHVYAVRADLEER